MLEWLKSMLSDNSGGTSTMRVCLLLWVITICFNITYGTIKNKPYALTTEVAMITACLAGAKAIQRFGENTNISMDSTGQITQANGVPVSTLPLTVSVQGSVPIQGVVPIQQIAQPTPQPVVAPVAIPTPPVVATPPEAPSGSVATMP